MSTFGHVVENIVNRISAAKSDKQQRAQSTAMTAENMFGQIGTLIQELQPRLAEKFPDLKPNVSLSGWVETEKGVANTLKLKSSIAEKEIPLVLTLGQSNVSVDGKIIPSRDSLNVLGTEIANFFCQ